MASPRAAEITIIRSLRNLQQLRSAWQDLCDRPESSGSVFQTPQWVLAWCGAFSPHNIFAIAAWQQDTLVGLAPLFFSEDTGELLFLGDPLNDENTFLTDRIQKQKILAELFHAISDHSCASSLLVRASAGLSMVPDGSLLSRDFTAWKANEMDREPGALLMLAPDWNEYLGRLPFPQKKKTIYVLRRAEKDLGIRFAMDSSPHIAPAEVRSLLELRKESMNYRGLWRLCPPAARNGNFSYFVESICSEAEARSSGAYLARLYSGTSLVAAGLYLRFQRTVMKYCQGWTTQLYKYSPGMLLDLKVIGWCISKQMRVFDLGLGDEPYKQHLGADLNELIISRFERISEMSCS